MTSQYNAPRRVSPSHNFGITPFGIYCFECRSPVGEIGTHFSVDLIKKHMNRKHKCNGNAATNWLEIKSSLNEGMKQHFGNVRNYEGWIIKKNIPTYNCSCGFYTKRKANLDRHIERMETKAPEQSHAVAKSFSCAVSSCGRTILTKYLQSMENTPIDVVTLEPVSNSSNTLSTITASDISNNGSNQYVPVKLNNKKWLTTKLENIRQIFNIYKRPDELLDPYLPSLKLLFIHSQGSVIERIKQDLDVMKCDDNSMIILGNNDECENNKSMQFFLDSTSQWLRVYCREHVSLLDGDIRFELQSFVKDMTMATNGYNLTFNMRENEDVIWRELQLMIRFVWNAYFFNQISALLKTTLTPIMAAIRRISVTHNFLSSPEATEDMIEGLVIQRFMHSIFMEKKANAYSLLLGHQLVMTRLFFKKNNSSDSNELMIRSCSEFGSIVALHLHIYRLGSASLIACTESQSWPGIINEMNISSLCHVLSPLIKKTKQMNNSKIEVRSKKINDNGDIIIDDFTFERCKWCKIIQIIIVKFNGIMEKVFANDTWKEFVDYRKSIQVKRIGSGNVASSDDTFHYDFWMNTSGRVIRQSQLSFKTNIAEETIERMTGLVMICLHGLGLGSTRITELLRLQQHQMEFKGGSFYYISISNKRRSCDVSNKKVVTHKLPASISRYLLLYDYIGRQYSKGRDCFLFGGGSNNKINSNYENREFYTEFSSIFELTLNCSSLVMRHVYTSICNYIFPGNNNNFDKNIVSTVDTIAEMSGHSAEVHEQFYSSTINKETFFDTYHRNLGENTVIDIDDSNKTIPLALQKDVTHYLKVIYGTNANFLSDLQMNLVIDSCNNKKKHTFCSIGCGGGKSLAWIMPVVREQALGFRSKLRIIVIPYCFLLDHHIHSTIKTIGQCSGISVEKLNGTDIHNNILPNVLRDRDNLPGLLFLSLEAMAELVRHHFLYLQELGEEGLLEKIYVDECHTILSELNFRSKYHAISRLAALNIPTVLFTGTIQRSFICDYMNYMFGSKDTGMYQMFVDSNIFTDIMIKIEHNSSKSYIEKSCNHVVEFASKYSSANVHVIVSTVDEGRSVYERLKSISRYECEFIYSGSENQDCIARKWNGNEIRILISTTLGLVGNESSKTQMVCLVGLHYNLPSIIQSIGRIRPKTRTRYSLCSIFTSNDNVWRIQENKTLSRAAFRELVGCKIISEDCKDRYFKSMTMTSVNNWLFSDDGCRMVSLGKRMGYSIKTDCKLCDKCIGGTNVRKASLERKKRIDIVMKQREDGIQLLNTLKQRCICCNRSTCSGTCVVQSMKGRFQCYHCLGNHTAAKCGVYKPILKNKACYSCYVFNYDQSVHHTYTDCNKDGEIKERLRALIQYDFREKTKNINQLSSNRGYNFEEQLAGIYASEESFFRFLNKYKDWK